MAKKGDTDKIGKTTKDDKDKDFAGSGVEGQKTGEPTVVTGSDVLKNLRAKGVRI